MKPRSLPPFFAEAGEAWRRIAETVNALVKAYPESSATADRPASPLTGQMHFDTTIGRPIWWDGSAWVDPRVDQSGLTAARPASPATGQRYFDTTLGQPIWWDGTEWVDATGAAA